MRPGSPCVCNRFGRARRRRRPRQHPGPRPTGVHGRRRGPEVAVGPIRRSLSPNRRPSRLPHGCLDGRAAPSRPRRKAHICCLSGGTDGVSPAGGSAAEDAWSALTRRPAATPLRPTPVVCHARGPSGKRHGGSIPRPLCAAGTPRRPADRRLTPAHTRFRRAEDRAAARLAKQPGHHDKRPASAFCEVRLADLFHNRAATPPCTRHFATRSASGRPQPRRSTRTAPKVVSRRRSRTRRSERARRRPDCRRADAPAGDRVAPLAGERRRQRRRRTRPPRPGR